ncbi:Glutathione import ATP-binding protein GsiA [Pseudoclavibacter triregionum]|nr:Glutathione import ATP-binding protein GsiA [Pseudoclavibacter triregionum]
MSGAAHRADGTDVDAPPLVDARGVRIAFPGRLAVDGASLRVAAGQLVALVGDSGAGKSALSRALLGLAGDGASVTAERLEVCGVEVTGAGERELRTLRRTRVGVVAQDALGSLDPLRRVGRALDERLRDADDAEGRRASAADRRSRALALLERAGFPPAEAPRVLRALPGELSGGQRQRALIALALAGDPSLVIADEPSASLDATLAEASFDLLRELARQGLGVLAITHDLSLALPRAERIVVLSRGRVLAEGPPAELAASADPEVRRLLGHPAPDGGAAGGSGAGSPEGAEPSAARAAGLAAAADAAKPDLEELAGEEPAAGAAGPRRDAPALAATGIRRAFAGAEGELVVLDGASLEIAPGELVALLGPSGSGKSTLGRILLGLDRPDAGEVRVGGTLRLDAHRPAALRGAVGMVPQDPLGNFDPRRTVGGLLRDARRLAADRAAGVPAPDRAWVARALEEVGLDSELARTRPRRLSGGQRQRVAIARALAAEPRALVCDEPTSALDASTRGLVLDLLDRIRRERGLAVLLITHDPAVAARADRTLRLAHGRLAEAG